MGESGAIVTPELCAICGESLRLHETEPNARERLLDPDDEVTIDGRKGGAHRVCLFRAVAGSAAHIEGRCSCRAPGASDTDDPALTKLQAAEASLAAFRKARTWRV